MNVSDKIWADLADCGVKRCFFLPGGGSMFLIDALARQDRIEKTALLHEQSCAIASDGFNQYHGYLASVVCVTTGPGGTNAITGVAASWIDSTPLLVISGQVPTNMMMENNLKQKVIQFGSTWPDGYEYYERQKGPQEVAITSIVKPITKFSGIMVNKTGRPTIKDVVEIASKGIQGPVWVDVPLDVQSASV